MLLLGIFANFLDSLSHWKALYANFCRLCVFFGATFSERIETWILQNTSKIKVKKTQKKSEPVCPCQIRVSIIHSFPNETTLIVLCWRGMKDGVENKSIQSLKVLSPSLALDNLTVLSERRQSKSGSSWCNYLQFTHLISALIHTPNFIQCKCKFNPG